ncbi:hypothetical protein J4232_05610 [Candidatus Woesearchaeota archaeon]|nr:hypothetical protein [Candidatus Woesearchaeota archaeon]
MGGSKKTVEEQKTAAMERLPQYLKCLLEPKRVESLKFARKAKVENKRHSIADIGKDYLGNMQKMFSCSTAYSY